MRSAAFLLCLFFVPAVAGGQPGIVTGPAVRSYPRQSFFVGPSYRGTGDYFQVRPRSANVYLQTQTWQGGSTMSSGTTTWVNSATPRPHATYFRNPYYPSLNFTPQVDMRPQEYVIPPVTRTPLHDPYFEERVYSPYDDGFYDDWGW